MVDMAVPEVEELPENLPPELKELLGEVDLSTGGQINSGS